MLPCPNCGGELRFDAESQRLKCTKCASLFDADSFDEVYGEGYQAETKSEIRSINQKETLESESSRIVEDSEPKTMRVTSFYCPQCGGEIYSTDDTAASFCSYCGASVVMESRINEKVRPNYIIPFKISKEEAKKKYRSKVMGHLLLPKAMKSENFMEEARGIYMPYWVYDVEQKEYRLVGKKQEGDTLNTLAFTGHTDNFFRGLHYDAQKSFADEISQGIAPYNVKDMVEFSPSYLAGYYADVDDVSASTYKEDAKSLAAESTVKFIQRKTSLGKWGYELDTIEDAWPSATHTEITAVNKSLMPVWFLAYRNKDRVSYATVNGQTGKVSADLPVSITKFVILALLCMIPIYFMIDGFLSLVPEVLMVSMATIAGAITVLYRMQIRQLERHERRINQPLHRISDKDEDYSKKDLKAMGKGAFLTYLITGVVLFVLIALFSEMGASLSIQAYPVLIAIIVFVVFGQGCLMASMGSEWKHYQSLSGFPFHLLPFLGNIGLCVFSFFHPVPDYPYYIASFLMIALIFVTLGGMLSKFNLMATRPLPQFESHRGGDDE